ncbi:MAG: SDR family NAD(P)-dependent oxidoreductase [Oceanicoccus sp.]|uniref:SDR family NAD(P)-dependent oxidoreductase n=1 Tax=Oceanicoccus sp. TaxID=2691044 RepID=UPI002615E26D|nr:SDR family NAD(P)-dependent oxidoreductase [Oceanicoccus sp.]MDG1772269.1 SDR family NAD(P)-dependent oxidoreductase [Oceanicoccus sp.]
MSNQNIVIIGASGGLGSAFVNFFADNPDNTVYAFSRSEIKNQLANVIVGRIDYADEISIQQAAEQSAQNGPLDCVIVATGMLHGTDLMPEKSLRDLTAEKFQHSFLANTIGPALIAKHFLPKLQRKQRAVFAALSARVGSIEDNRLGGWYAYRASKAALNMLIKTASIEIARRQQQTIVVGLHPGTVDTNLSQPFQQRVPSNKLFTTEYSAQRLISVLNELSEQDSGKVFAWDGSEVPF